MRQYEDETKYHMHTEGDSVQEAVEAIAEAQIPFEDGCDFRLSIKADTKEEFQAVIAAWASKLGVEAPVPEEDVFLDYPDCSELISSARHGATRVCNAALRLEMDIDKGTYEQALDNVINVIWKCNDFITWLGATDEELYEAYKRVCTDE